MNKDEIDQIAQLHLEDENRMAELLWKVSQGEYHGAREPWRIGEVLGSAPKALHSFDPWISFSRRSAGPREIDRRFRPSRRSR
jgi:hypothetical protein